MDTLVELYPTSLNNFQSNRNSISILPPQNHADPYKLNPGFQSNSAGESPPEPEKSEERDFSDAVLKYISQMLMEEDDLENKPCMFQDCLALQAAEKSFYDVIGEKYPPSISIVHNNQNRHWSPSDELQKTYSNHSLAGSDWTPDSLDESNYSFESIFDAVNVPETEDPSLIHLFNYDSESTDKKYHDREEIEENRSSKQLATYTNNESETSDLMYDQVLLCPVLNPGLHDNKPGKTPIGEEQQPAASENRAKTGSNRGRPRGKKQGKNTTKEVVDLRGLLIQCSQAVSNYDGRTAYELLNRIRKHSSSHGDATERLAHYFADGLEARLAGTGTELYTAFKARNISAAEILKAYHVFVWACPFKKLSNIFANKSIQKLAAKATKVHIIDFGILYGFQWPCLIQGLSVRPGGPPKLRITGIDLPQPGRRPAERVEETGNRLKNYCRRFNVPFEYNTIAKKWETIKLEDLKIDRDEDELVIVNCLYRLSNVPDETVIEESPRDSVLDLIRRINPDLFIHGVINGTYNAPFFVTRFREALFHFSALFDMFEATMERENRDRMMFEQEVFGRDAMNIIACEGTERVERPETYKQWQVRNVRAGFKQLPLSREIVKCVREKVRSNYHKDFVVDEDGNWMLQGWKGRVINALSCWKPVRKN